MAIKNYEKGEPIKSLDELMRQEFIILFNKVYHRGWFGCWQLFITDVWIKQGFIFKAIKLTAQ